MLLQSDCKSWDDYTYASLSSSPYHLSAWKNVVATTYGHKTHYLIALKQRHTGGNFGFSQVRHCQAQTMDKYETNMDQEVVGILPFIQIKHWLFGSNLSSMPFCDSGGVLATDGGIERILIEQGLWIANTLRMPVLELRQYQPLVCLSDYEFIDETSLCRARGVKTAPGWYVSTLVDNKVRMLVDLPGDPDILMKSFKPKLRSQIRKPIKEGLTVKIGSIELVDDFYNVFVENMRDLGSPVHSKKFITETVKAFPNTANVFIVYGNHKPLAGSVTIGFKDTLSNPWASSLRRYSHLAPNMLLYWSMLEFACQNGYRRFDFGRSTNGEGTYKFKEQWGAKPEPLYWYRFSKTDDQGWGRQPNKDKMSKAIEYWKKLPVPVTKIIGPRIRKYISL